MSKTATKKEIIILNACDFPFEPDTGECFTGIKSMEMASIGYDFPKYLKKRINEGDFTLKDVAELFFDYLNVCSWEEFCMEFDNPNNNIDAFTDWLTVHDDEHCSFFITETDKKVIFCPVREYRTDKVQCLLGIVHGICTLFSNGMLSDPKTKTKTICIGKVTVNDIHTVSEEKANVAPLSAPMFTKL